MQPGWCRGVGAPHAMGREARATTAVAAAPDRAPTNPAAPTTTTPACAVAAAVGAAAAAPPAAGLNVTAAKTGLEGAMAYPQVRPLVHGPAPPAQARLPDGTPDQAT